MHGLYIGVAIKWWQNLCIEVVHECIRPLLANLVTYVTGFAKTVPNGTRIESHL